MTHEQLLDADHTLQQLMSSGLRLLVVEQCPSGNLLQAAVVPAWSAPPDCPCHITSAFAAVLDCWWHQHTKLVFITSNLSLGQRKHEHYWHDNTCMRCCIGFMRVRQSCGGYSSLPMASSCRYVAASLLIAWLRFRKCSCQTPAHCISEYRGEQESRAACVAVASLSQHMHC